MKINETKVTIRELVDGFGEDATTGQVVGYGGKLDIRPAYQREFVYPMDKQEAVINTIMQGFPLNIMYWVDCNNNGCKYEVMDGQQRTISICRFVNDQGISVKWGGKDCNFSSLPADKQKEFLDYQLTVYRCSGTESEKLEWFEIINIAGVTLTKQELRNATYTGHWLEDAKKYFSKRGCAALKNLGHAAGKNPFGDYLSITEEDCIRQNMLELALEWIVEFKKKEDKSLTIEKYMAAHRNASDAAELKQHYENVMNWAKSNFKVYRRGLLKGQKWGHLYAEHHSDKLNSDDIEKRIAELVEDETVTNQKGIVPYILTGNESKLNLRAFSEKEMQRKYDEQKGICPKCGKHFDRIDMAGDHVVPWSKGGRTEYANLQMLCKDCNGRKSNH